jgi:hypothetical protein
MSLWQSCEPHSNGRIGLVYIVTCGLEIDEIERLKKSGAEIVRQGGFAVIRDYFGRFDDEETSEVEYFIVRAQIGTDHLVDGELVNRALKYFVKSQGGSVVIPRSRWDNLSGRVIINQGARKIWLIAGSGEPGDSRGET